MSTNYYLVKNRPSVSEPLHIGKSSAGWRFLFHKPSIWETDVPLNTFESWRDYLKEQTENGSHVIMNEYDEVVDYEWLMRLIESKQSENRPGMFEYCENVNGYRFASGEFSWEVEQVTERLTETYPCDLCNVEFCYRQCYKMTLWAEKAKEKLAEYENAEEEGRMVVLPCDTVYFICDKGTKDAHVRTKSILDLLVYDINGIDKDGRYWSVKEEAEKALKEMKKNE